MYFWKIELLKKELISNGLNQKSLFIYILMYVLFVQVVLEASYIFPSEEGPTELTYIQALIDLVAATVGSYLCYYANGGSAGSQFAERFFSIGFVVGIRFLVLLIPITIAYSVFMGVAAILFGIDPEDPIVNISVMFVMALWLIAFYWRVIIHINQVARSCKA